MELWLDDLHLEIGRLVTSGQARTSKMDASLFCFHTGNDDIHLGAFRYVSLRIQPDLPVLYDAFKRLRAHIQDCNGFQRSWN
jgi:hypothetical protein